MERKLNLKCVVGLILMIPIIVSSQNVEKVIFSDTIIDLNMVLVEKFGKEIEPQISEQKNNPDGSYTMSYLELKSNNNENGSNKKLNNISTPALCECKMIGDKIELSNAFGFFGGVANVIQINIKDSTYVASLMYINDGGKDYKLNKDDEFSEQIQLFLKKSELILFGQSEFKDKGKIRGRLSGVTNSYYKKDNSKIGFSIEEDKVYSEFECKLKDLSEMYKKLIEAESKRKNDGKKNE